MKHIKSERLKKLETELNDLEQWLKLGLVPKKDMEKHREEIIAVRAKIEEEKERLQFLKESGEGEEYVTPKRAAGRTGYTDMPTIPDVDIAESATGINESHFDVESEADTMEAEASAISEGDEEEAAAAAEEAPAADEEEGAKEEEDEESYFSERNRWRRGGIQDPDANEW